MFKKTCNVGNAAAVANKKETSFPFTSSLNFFVHFARCEAEVNVDARIGLMFPMIAFALQLTDKQLRVRPPSTSDFVQKQVTTNSIPL